MNTSILNDQIKYPVSYDRNQLQTQWVHIGFGAFHRAHQALLTHQLAALGETDWGICEVNLLGGIPLMEQLRAQDHRYTVLEKGAQSNQLKVIDIIKESLHLELDGIQSIIDKLASPAVKIVSLTITEKGYCLDPGTGHLDKASPAVAHDLAYPDSPKTALGFIVCALKQRKEQGLASFSVMSCDNIQGNGHVVKKAVLELAQLQDPELCAWIETHVTFPCTMVDRIVPAATEDSLKEIALTLGGEDPCGIVCEPFIQWVIEDNFVAGRPDWNKVGAEFVDDVIPYEEMKLRMLNGSHSFLAYLGYLAGYQTIDEAIADPDFATAAKNLMMQEQAPTLSVPKGTDLEAYAQLLMERYSNPNLKHRTWQIAMDGSQKLPQRFLKSIRVLMTQNKSFRHLALAIAGWMVYVEGTDEQGNNIDVRDPMADKLKTLCLSASGWEEKVHNLIAVDTIFGELKSNKLFVDTILSNYKHLIHNGAKKSVQDLNH